MASRLDLLPRGLDRRDDVRVGAAAADVAAHLLADLVVGLRPPLAEQRDRAHDLTRRAEPALERVVLDERGLHRMQLVAAREPLDRRDLRALGGDRQRQAGIDRLAVAQHGARTALAMIAALAGPGE